MFKKFLALAAGTLISLNASAGYIQYQLDGPIVSGKVVIREEDKSVAWFGISGGLAHFTVQDRGDLYHNNMLIETTTSFTGMGPTNMYMRDVWQEESSSQGWLMFSEGDAPGTFNYSMRVLRKAGPHAPYPYLIPTVDITYSGTARATPMAAGFADYLDTATDFVLPRDIPYYDPTQVPEPASLALMVVGAFGALGAARPRKAAA